MKQKIDIDTITKKNMKQTFSAVQNIDQLLF